MDLVAKVELVTRLCADSRLSGDQARVAVALILHFHNTGNGACFPSMTQLAEASCTTKRTVQRAIAVLEAMGVLTVDRTDGGRNRRNTYFIETVSPAPPSVTFAEVTTVSPAPLNGVTSAPLTVSPAPPLLSRNKPQEITQEDERALEGKSVSECIAYFEAKYSEGKNGQAGK
jgi:hypothetical protein